ncbi:MAG: acetate--CoA ligase family protein [Alphaproteobacteria bacterium]
MNDVRRGNLLRLLKPRHVAVIGGGDAVTVAGECRRIGYDGPFWPVNPKRAEIGGYPCYPTVEDLPEAPDAVFIAVPREAAIDTLAKLNVMGAGGAVCYTAGFGEIGEEGRKVEDRLIEAAGDMALIGPNCYGMINYIDRVALWPFAHGGDCPGYGAAIITQSGMLSSDLTMSQRSVPFSYMISAGNQTQLHLEDFIDVLCEREEVPAIGLHIEGLKDAARFEAAALKALSFGKPIVALKTGSSSIGASLTVSHTGSLSGEDTLYDALFDRLGIVRVESPAELLETLKFFCVAGIPKGKRVGGLTCSGGGATMLADMAEKRGLEMPQPPEATRSALRNLLPFTATVSNPLDYTTPIWGNREKTEPVFRTFLDDGYDSAILIQDYPAPGLDESHGFYFADALGFVAATTDAGMPAAVCSTLPENMDEQTRQALIGADCAPMQGLAECLTAVRAAVWYGERRQQIDPAMLPLKNAADTGIARPVLLDEKAAKDRLSAAGIRVPDAVVTCEAGALADSRSLTFPVALKMLSPRLPHKTEAGAVRLNIASPDDLPSAVAAMITAVTAYNPDAARDRFLIETMADKPVAELLVTVRRDPTFGLALTVGVGGVLVEILKDATTILLPAARADIERALTRLRIAPLFAGHRGKPAADMEKLVDTIEAVCGIMIADTGEISEIEINPLFVLPDRVVAVDALMQVRSPEPGR